MNRILLLALVLALSGCGRPHFGSVAALEAAFSGPGAGSGSSDGSGPPDPSKAGTTAGSDTTPGAGAGGAAGGSGGGVVGTTGGNPGLVVTAKSDGQVKELTLFFLKEVSYYQSAQGVSTPATAAVDLAKLDLDKGRMTVTVTVSDRDATDLRISGINQPTFTLAPGCDSNPSVAVTNSFGTFQSIDRITFKVSEGGYPATDNDPTNDHSIDFDFNFKPALDRLAEVGDPTLNTTLFPDLNPGRGADPGYATAPQTIAKEIQEAIHREFTQN